MNDIDATFMEYSAVTCKARAVAPTALGDCILDYSGRVVGGSFGAANDPAQHVLF